jgi:transposase
MQESMSQIEKSLKEEYDVLHGELSEKGRRKWAGFQAQRLGHGGKTAVHRATGLDYKTIKRGIREIEGGEELEFGRVRQSGGGRKSLTTLYPNLERDLERLLEDSTRGDPENPLKWTSKSTLKLCQALRGKGYQISQRSVCTLLEVLGYSLQANRKTKEGGNHPDRDAQFSFINNKVKEFQKAKQPVISVDTKKKELIGNYKNAGREYHKKGQTPEVNVYDFLDEEKGKVAPYGVYDLDKNQGWVSVGISSDTAEFAVNSIRSWWNEMGQETYKNATCLYINADGGGSNGSRNRLWKKELQKFANDMNLEIHVSHFPPGTSKWNKIEHRLFSFISTNWRGKPLIDRVTVVSLIANTTTKTGLKIKVKLDERNYKTGIKVSEKEMQLLNLHKDTFHGEWNYFIKPN